MPDLLRYPLVALRNAQGQPILAWGSDHLRANPSARPGYRAIVLTAEGIQDPGHRLEAQGLRVIRCGYLDNGNLAQARAQVERCAPEAARLIQAGLPTLVVCAAGENRSAIMTARIRHLLTGEPGAAIVTDMQAIPRDRGRTFSNGVFRRWAASWPAVMGAPLENTNRGTLSPGLKLGVGVGLAGVAVLLLILTLNLGKRTAAAAAANQRRRRQRYRLSLAA